MTFEGRLAVEQVDARRWRLLEPLAYRASEHRYQNFTAPEGYVTDFATTPRFVHWLYGPSGDYSRAAVIHDWLLTDTTLPHRTIDRLFRLMLADLGIPWPRRWVLWTGVRWGSLTRSKAARKDWLRDAPLVLVWSIPMAALLILPTISIGLSMLVIRLIEVLTPDTASVSLAGDEDEDEDGS